MAFNKQYTALAVEHLTGLKANVDFELADLGDGIPVITVWHSTTVQQPTQAQIGAVDTDALINPPHLLADYDMGSTIGELLGN